MALTLQLSEEVEAFVRAEVARPRKAQIEHATPDPLPPNSRCKDPLSP
jgi:hypothetical protein